MPKSRTPESRKARRIVRQYLYALTIAADASQEKEIREFYQARAEKLEPVALAASKSMASNKAAAKAEKVAKAA